MGNKDIFDDEDKKFIQAEYESLDQQSAQVQ